MAMTPDVSAQRGRAMAEVATARSTLRSPGFSLVGHVLTFAVYILLALWAAEFTFDKPEVPLIWPATGIALAAIWRFGYGVTVTVFMASLIAHLALDFVLLDATLMGLGNAASAALGAWLLARLGFRGDLGTMGELYRLAGVGVGVTALFSGFGGALVAVGLSPDLAKAVLLCWLADAMGVALFAPVFVSARWERLTAGRWLAAVGALLLVAATTLVIYSDLVSDQIALPLSYAVFPMVMLVALRFPPWMAAGAVMVTSLVAVHCTAMNKGPFAHAGMGPDLLSLHAQLALLAMTGLFLAALRQERLAAEARSREHLHTLARAGRVNAMSALAAGIAHEINQPLCAVSSYAQSANRLLQRGADAGELQAPLERIVTTADRASDIVRRMRGFLAEGDSEAEHVDLNHPIREACDLMRPEFRRREVELRLELATGPVGVCLEALGMQQVVVNLLQNALESVDGGGNAARRWVRVCTAVTGDGRHACLSVIDGGPGLRTPGDETLFEPFITTRRSGMGLGLSISRSIVEAEGGRILASNEPGAGARFDILLPLHGDGGEAGGGRK